MPKVHPFDCACSACRGPRRSPPLPGDGLDRTWFVAPLGLAAATVVIALWLVGAL